MVNKKVDYLIVGQGLAGTFLAFQLMQKGKTVLVVDKGLQYSSSRVAAGVINPIVLKRFTITWRAMEFLQYNPSFYNQLDAYLGKQFHFDLPLKKLISSRDEIDFWEHRYHKENVSDFIHRELTPADDSILPAQDFKVGTIKQASWLNIAELLPDFRSRLKYDDALLEESFDFNALKKKSYKSIDFTNLIFCEGHKAKDNPLFKNLPFSLNKGQLFTISTDQLPADRLLKKKVFILPTAKNEFKIGATYSWKWDTTSEETTHQIEDDKTELLKSQLEEMTTANYSVKTIETGIRPAVKDRRPLIGQHPEKENIYLLNGMGSRGCFMAPLLVNELINHIENGTPLHEEVDLKRYS